MDDRIRQAKEEFFRYRNGIVADTLRKAGYPHKVIFGLSVPQIAQIARMIGTDTDLALRLWDDREVRESRVLATYLFPADATSRDLAMRLCVDVRTQEEADMLAFRLLKRLPCARELLLKLKEEQTEEAQRCTRALEAHLS